MDKGRIYARAGVPVYWIVNVANGQPQLPSPAYVTGNDYTPTEIAPVVLDGETIAELPVAESLP